MLSQQIKNIENNPKYKGWNNFLIFLILECSTRIYQRYFKAVKMIGFLEIGSFLQGNRYAKQPLLYISKCDNAITLDRELGLADN